VQREATRWPQLPIKLRSFLLLLLRRLGRGFGIHALTLFVWDPVLQQLVEASLVHGFEALHLDLIEFLLAGLDTQDDVVGVLQLRDHLGSVLDGRGFAGVAIHGVKGAGEQELDSFESARLAFWDVLPAVVLWLGLLLACGLFGGWRVALVSRLVFMVVLPVRLRLLGRLGCFGFGVGGTG